ncbi:MAG: hypothetical protein WDW36_000740 [Sanguina aurantia]
MFGLGRVADKRAERKRLRKQAVRSQEQVPHHRLDVAGLPPQSRYPQDDSQQQQPQPSRYPQRRQPPPPSRYPQQQQHHHPQRQQQQDQNQNQQRQLHEAQHQQQTQQAQRQQSKQEQEPGHHIQHQQEHQKDQLAHQHERQQQPQHHPPTHQPPIIPLPKATISAAPPPRPPPLPANPPPTNSSHTPQTMSPVSSAAARSSMPPPSISSIPQTFPGRLMVGSWNLEQFTMHGKDTRVSGEKIGRVADTLVCCLQRLGAGGLMIVALQEVLAPAAVTCLVEALALKSARAWGCFVTQQPVGRYGRSEFAAFIWTDSPSICLDPATHFHVLTGQDLAQHVRTGKADASKGFLRSPLYGLFRVGAANLLLLNCHLSATATDAAAEVAMLDRLVTAIRADNAKLEHRFSFFNLVRSSQRRGAILVLGDFNLPIPASLNPLPPCLPPPPSHPPNTLGADSDAPTMPQTRAQTALQRAHPATPWQVFQRFGYANLVPAHLPTNSPFAKSRVHIDDIFLPASLAPRMAIAAGVEQPPASVTDKAGYPNHLFVWAELDMSVLQPGTPSVKLSKIRPLHPPRMK